VSVPVGHIYPLFNLPDIIKARRSEPHIDFIRSKTDVLNFTTVRYSLYKCSETILTIRSRFTAYVKANTLALELFLTMDSLATKIISPGRSEMLII